MSSSPAFAFALSASLLPGKNVLSISFLLVETNFFITKQLLHKFLASRHLNPLSNSIGSLCLESLLVHHLLPHLPAFIKTLTLNNPALASFEQADLFVHNVLNNFRRGCIYFFFFVSFTFTFYCRFLCFSPPPMVPCPVCQQHCICS